MHKTFLINVDGTEHAITADPAMSLLISFTSRDFPGVIKIPARTRRPQFWPDTCWDMKAHRNGS